MEGRGQGGKRLIQGRKMKKGLAAREQGGGGKGVKRLIQERKMKKGLAAGEQG